MSLQSLLAEYRLSHKNPINKWVHYICVPAITFSTLGLAWLVDLNSLGMSSSAGRWINLATVGGVCALVYYLSLSVRALFAMLIFTAPMIAGIVAVESAGLPLGWIAFGIFIVAWIAQLYGHKVEGAKPSFLKDLQFLLIGPLFVIDEWGFLNVEASRSGKGR